MTTISCPSCGHTAQTTAKYCPDCGANLKGRAGAATGKSTGMRDTIIIVAALLLAGTAYFVLRQPSPRPEAPVQSANPADQGLPPQHPPLTGPGSQEMAGAEMPQLNNLPTDYAGLVDAGNHHMDNAEFPMAAECYRRALAIDGKSVDVRTDYGACLHGMGLAKRALEEFQKVLAQDSKHTICIFNIGIVYNDLKQIDSSRYYWNRYLELEPNGKAAEQARHLLKQLGT
ncbi:MAG: zinc-ribbon domain-containing protein [candidate division Zixibacteria bacterium]|nr:zinc-ribbon domain-containing protein [candidate division Zixibacteria bacterium]